MISGNRKRRKRLRLKLPIHLRTPIKQLEKMNALYKKTICGLSKRLLMGRKERLLMEGVKPPYNLIYIQCATFQLLLITTYYCYFRASVTSLTSTCQKKALYQIHIRFVTVNRFKSLFTNSPLLQPLFAVIGNSPKPNSYAALKPMLTLTENIDRNL